MEMLVEHTPEMAAGDAMQATVMASLRQAVGDMAKYIEVTVENGTVTLVGPVESWAERDALLEAAQTTPGVEHVINHTHLRGYRFSW
jgi:osmotically-inducible protein OsmY